MSKRKANEPDFVYQQLLDDELRNYANGRALGPKEARSLSRKANDTKLEALNRELSEISKKIDEFEVDRKKGENVASENLAKLEGRLTKSEEGAQKLSEKINQEKARSIEMVAVFVALLTFISAEIQLFKTLDKPNEVAGFSLLMAGLLVFFVLAMEVVLWGSDLLRKDRLRFFTLLVFCLVFVVFGSIFLGVFDGMMASGAVGSDK